MNATHKYILLDIEGTVCAISFVKDVLFPYFLSELPAVLGRHFSATPPPDLQNYIDAFPPAVRTSYEGLYKHITELTASDVKAPELKSLQGYVWRKGYEDGELKVPLFPDVYSAFELWGRTGASRRRVSIYSSGSVDAQILLFSHTYQGDLTKSIEGYFDTVNAGPKTDRTSYEIIADAIAPGESKSQILFLSDNVKEIEAALGAGLDACVVDRPGNYPLSEQDRAKYTVLNNFDTVT